MLGLKINKSNELERRGEKNKRKEENAREEKSDRKGEKIGRRGSITELEKGKENNATGKGQEIRN